MTRDPATLRLYASIFEKPWRDPRSGDEYPPPEASMAAAEALRFMAEAIELAVPTTQKGGCDGETS